MQKKVYFITGGAKSGKSALAEKLASDIPGKRAYIATAQALDEEMAAKIERHKRDRTGAWDTFEEPCAVADLLIKLNGSYDVVLLDCLTLWLSNVMLTTESDQRIRSQVDALVSAIKECTGACIIVSNEVGLGIVPENALARRFRDLAGMLNQQVARAADEAYMAVAGIAVKIK